jgi:alpha-tubulin suppressor-like RCC1 family protein
VVVCWGRSTEGQLGDGVSGSKLKPVAVKGLTDAVDLVAGGNHTCARRKAGSVVCWGSNGQGQLGDGKTGVFAQRTPVVVQGLQSPARLALGKQHSCARMADGAVRCWGANQAGQLGAAGSSQTRPTAVTKLTDATDLALGTAHSCALQSTGNVTCWGSDDHRALGPRRL